MYQCMFERAASLLLTVSDVRESSGGDEISSQKIDRHTQRKKKKQKKKKTPQTRQSAVIKLWITSSVFAHLKTEKPCFKFKTRKMKLCFCCVLIGILFLCLYTFSIIS